MLQSITEYNIVLQSITDCHRIVQSITEYYKVLRRITEYCRVLQSIAEYCRVLPIYLVTRMRRQVWRCHSITLPVWNAPTNTISDQTLRPLCLFVCWSLKKISDRNTFCCQQLSKASMHILIYIVGVCRTGPPRLLLIKQSGRVHLVCFIFLKKKFCKPPFSLSAGSTITSVLLCSCFHS